MGRVVSVLALSALASAGLLAACAATPAPPLTDSDIVNIATVFIAEKARSTLVNRYWQREETRWAVDCVSEWESADMGQRLAPLLRKNLSTEELQQTHEFLSTGTGKLYAERAVYHAPRGPLSPGQAADLKAFASSPAAIKLLNPRSAAQFTDALAAASVDKLTECKKQRDSKPPSQPEPAVVPVSIGQLSCTVPQVVYPADARRNEQSGKATVRFWTNTRGLVYLTLVVESSNVFSLDDAAETAVKGMQCKPYVANGKAIRVTARQPVAFELR